MSEAFSQTILHVDLSTERIWKEKADQGLVTRYLGGRGIGAKVLWDQVDKNVDPLDSSNLLIFAAGTLVGTNAPTAGRLSITTKGAQTGIFLKTSVGGHFGTVLRMAGYDVIVVHGASDHPVYLWIDRQRVELRDGRPLWGKGTRETTRILTGQSDGGVEVGCIGPAGENGVRFASIMFSYYSAAARGGAGTVMGSKKLKAIAVDGQGGKITVAHPREFGRVVMEAREALYKDTLSTQLFEYGTAADVDFFNELHLTPSYNFKRSYIDDPGGARRLSGRNWPKQGYLKHRRACSACTIGCHRYTEVKSGKYAGTYSGGPQLETVNATGPRCGNTDVELVFKMNELCNDMGLDVSTTGSVIGWLMETYERGLLADRDLDGVKPDWGAAEAMVELLHRIVRREGVGDLLADGTRTAAERVGGDSYQWAVQIKGLEITALELRAAYAYALAFAVNSRGGDHLLSETIAEFGGTPEARAVMRKVAGDEKYIGGSVMDKRAEIVRWHEDIYAVTDALGICAFSTTAAYGIDEERAAMLFQYATGIDTTADQIMEAGRRIVTLERCFNIREGLTRKDDTLPWRFMHEYQDDLESVDDPILPQAKLDTMLDEYYRLHGWDAESGCPTEETLRQLGLGFVVGGLETD
jgi:aldehyde:ferredoxin oxidoreductase